MHKSNMCVSETDRLIEDFSVLIGKRDKNNNFKIFQETNTSVG